jgi:hypothetical protein
VALETSVRVTFSVVIVASFGGCYLSRSRLIHR